MPSRKLVVALTVTALAATIGPAASAKAGGNGNGNGHGQPPAGPTAYGNTQNQTACLPGVDVCTAGGTADLSSLVLHSQSQVSRSTAVKGPEDAWDMAYAGQYFTLTKPAKSVTATIHFTGVKVADSTDAVSPDNAAYAVAQIGASINDSACADFGCGATDAQKYVWVDDEVQFAGVTLTPVDNAQTVPGHETNSSPDQTITVTLSMPDGSDLPAGQISFAGITNAYSSLGDRQCTPAHTPAALPAQLQRDLPQQCAAQTKHTGTATTDISATIASITYTIS